MPFGKSIRWQWYAAKPKNIAGLSPSTTVMLSQLRNHRRRDDAMYPARGTVPDLWAQHYGRAPS